MTAALAAPRSFVVRELLPIDRSALVELLRSLAPEEWSRPTACAGWDVRDVALHILGGDLNNISRRRDAEPAATWGPGEDPGDFLAQVNQEWVTAARRFSPRLIMELLETTGPALFAYFETLDPAVLGGPVSWAGPGPAPVWLDLAREYMERWVHQQHIRDATGRPGQTDARSVRPVIAASMHSLPVAMAERAGDAHEVVVVRVPGNAGGTWSVVRQDQAWLLVEGAAQDARTTIEVTADDWWRLVTLGLRPDDVARRARVFGDADLAAAAFSAVAIIS